MLRDELLDEIEKWMEKLDDRIPKLEPAEPEGERLMANVKSYRSDSEHFLEEDELIESYEALIWAWAFLEIGEDLGHLKSSEDD